MKHCGGKHLVLDIGRDSYNKMLQLALQPTGEEFIDDALNYVRNGCDFWDAHALFAG